jgi:hypothetical protein
VCGESENKLSAKGGCRNEDQKYPEWDSKDNPDVETDYRGVYKRREPPWGFVDHRKETGKLLLNDLWIDYKS